MKHFTQSVSAVLLAAVAFAAQPLAAADQTMWVIIDTDVEGKISVDNIVAIDATGADTDIYYGTATPRGTRNYKFTVPEGKYDVLFSYKAGTDYVMLTINDATVGTQEVTYNLKMSDATGTTVVTHADPQGNPLKFIASGGTSPRGELTYAISHGTTPVSTSTLITDTGDVRTIKFNNKDSRFSYTCLDMLQSPYGLIATIVPVDFSKAENCSDATGWHTAEMKFVDNPASRLNREYKSAHGQPDYYFGVSPFMILRAGAVYRGGSFGFFEKDCRPDKVSMWLPAGYDGPFELVPVLTGASVIGEGSSTLGSPLRLTADGFQQMGINYMPGNYLLYYLDSKLVAPGYAPFSGNITTAELGNCAPILTFIPQDEFFDFTFKGRHGENMGQASESYSNPSSEYWTEVFGKKILDFKLSGDGSEITSNRVDFPWDFDWESERYTLDIATDNVLIDGELPGKVTATQTFGGEGMRTPASLTSLRFEDADGVINDRLADPRGAKMIFTGAQWAYAEEEDYVYAEFTSVDCVSVEYAPTGTETFAALTAVKGDEPVLPGYGDEFTVDLSAVPQTSADQWYDVRISIKAANGDSQTQTISPAFKVLALDGISDLTVGDADTAEAEIYDLQGRRVAPTAPGLYIVRRGNRVSKTIVR